MAQKQKGGGFHSSAGLMRYFDEEESKGPKLDHRLVIGLGIAAMVIIELAKWRWPVS